MLYLIMAYGFNTLIWQPCTRTDEIFIPKRKIFYIGKSKRNKKNRNQNIKLQKKFDIRNFIREKSPLQVKSKNTYIHGRSKFRHVYETDKPKNKDLITGMNILLITTFSLLLTISSSTKIAWKGKNLGSLWFHKVLVCLKMSVCGKKFHLSEAYDDTDF